MNLELTIPGGDFFCSVGESGPSGRRVFLRSREVVNGGAVIDILTVNFGLLRIFDWWWWGGV